jgi:hypothetical protein
MPKLTLIPPTPIQKDPDALLDAREVARILAVDISWVNNHCSRTRPLLPHAKFGKGRNSTRRFRREDIMKFIEEHMVHPKS